MNCSGCALIAKNNKIMITEIFYDALADSAKMIPILLAIYVGIELLEFKFGNTIKNRVQNAAGAGPLVGAIAGAFPQCGFSVIATALYTQRLATIGTLLAVYLSTSDEAVPIMMSYPNGARLILPFIAVKIVIGASAGFLIDMLFKKNNRPILTHIDSLKKGIDSPGHHHETVADKAACCGHRTDATSKKFNPKELLLHPVIHTVRIFIFIFLVSFVLGLVIDSLGMQTLAAGFAGAKLWQPLVAALIGLIPNCAASVAITELYLEGIITYGAALAGLCASGGLGLLVLSREEKEKKNVFLVIALLFLISVLVGYLTQFIF